MRRVLVAVLAGVMALSLGACSKDAGGNLGKDTKCGDFIKMDEKQQFEVLKKIEEQDPSDEPLKEEDLAMYAAFVASMCTGQEDKTIDEMANGLE
ncbi:MAG: hypothetical protein Q3999_01430 [Buchananella hordeovulneris]|nr:hypothetical protein [Buchananella hordeovulneris]